MFPVMSRSASTSLLRIRQLDIFQWIRMFALSSSNNFEGFIDKEFAKAEANLDTETLDDTHSLLTKLERDQKHRIRAADKARTARLFQPPRQPRSISWDTIEQIRYLKQENGEEWSTAKLATSFSIPRDLVIKVLKSKFVPTEKILRKQDQKARVNAGYLSEKNPQAANYPSSERALLSSSSKQRKTQITAPVTSHRSTEERHFTRKDSLSHPQRIPGQRSADKMALHEQAFSYPSKKTFQKKMRLGTDTPQDRDWDEMSNVRIADGNVGIHSDKRSKDHMSRGNKSHDQSHIHMSGRTEPELKGTEVEEELNIDMDNLESYIHVTEGSQPLQIIQRGNEFYDINGELLYRL